jgi:hypothetical protein
MARDKCSPRSVCSVQGSSYNKAVDDSDEPSMGFSNDTTSNSAKWRATQQVMCATRAHAAAVVAASGGDARFQ